MKTIAEVSKETLKIENYLKDKKPGEQISYAEIESQSGVPMDTKGKSYLRTALKRLKLEYSPLRGHGIELASPSNTMTLVTKKLVTIDNAVKRGEKTYNNLIPFYTELEDHEQKKINFIGAAFGAIRLAAENGKRMLKQQEKYIPQSKEFVRIE